VGIEDVDDLINDLSHAFKRESSHKKAQKAQNEEEHTETQNKILV